MLKFQIVLSAAVSVSCLGSAFAQSNDCYLNGYQVENIAGYNVGKNAQAILATDYSTKHTKGMTENEIIQRIQDRIAIYPTVASGNPVKDSTLAKNIFKVAKAYGLDPFVFAAKIEVESDFIIGVKNKNGTGLTQMTAIAVEELTYQYEKSDVGAIYRQLSARYYTNPVELNDWMYWAKKRYSNWGQKRNFLIENYRYSLTAGASFLKFQMAMNGANYAKALGAYNGGGTAGYSSNVSNLATKIDQTCSVPESLQKIIQISCLMSGSQEACDEIGHTILGTRPKGKSI